MVQTARIPEHEKICRELHNLYQRKNADYGNSFAKVREEIPNAILVRLSDKLNRLKSLMQDNKQQMVKNESIDDTLMDLANYAIMELVERRIDSLNSIENLLYRDGLTPPKNKEETNAS